jgi:peptidylprolyl isomerase
MRVIAFLQPIAIVSAALVAMSAPVLAARLSPGSTAPPISLRTAQGKLVRLSDYHGKLLAIEFCAEQTAPAQLRSIQRSLDQVAAIPAVVIAVAPSVRPLKNLVLEFPLLADPSGKARNAYGAVDAGTGKPSSILFIVDSTGKLSAASVPVDENAAGTQLVSRLRSVAGSSSPDAVAPQAQAPAYPGWPSQGKLVKEKDGLQYVDAEVGHGAQPRRGQTITVDYSGYLMNGLKFDSSVDRGQPFSFTVGAGQVIRGWDEGFLSMHVGGKRKLIIPPDLGYGATGTPGGPIPPNAVLVFDVQLLKVGN